MTPERMELLGLLVVFGGIAIFVWLYDAISFYLDQWGIKLPWHKNRKH